MTIARLTGEPIETARLLEAVRSSTDGAVLLFEGRVRGTSEGREVVRLEYEAYPEMGAAVLREIGEEAVERFAIGRVAVEHRVGALEPGDASVAIAVAAPHRADGYAASRYLIEEIKRRLPVWKKEVFADGGAEWVEGATPRPDPSTLPREAPAR